MFGSWNIPSVGEVQLTWLPNPPLPTVSSSSSPAGGTPGQDVTKGQFGNAAGTGSGADEDMTGMDNENENGITSTEARKEIQTGAHDVDYDVAEMDDSWGVE